MDANNNDDDGEKNDKSRRINPEGQYLVKIDNWSFGDTTLAQGAFGDISLSLLYSPTASSPGPGIRVFQWVAVKTLRNSLLNPNSSSSSWGGMMMMNSSGGSSTQQKETSERKWQLRREVFAEIAALRILTGHSNIVPLLHLETSSSSSINNISLVFPYCPFDLAQVLQNQRQEKRRIPIRVCKAILRDILSALNHCHSHHIVHRDIKPANFLISHLGHVQLTDFGLAKPIVLSSDSTEEEDEEDHALCTLHYRPPELLLGSKFPHHRRHSSLDMWSVGLVLVELLHLRPIFPGSSVLEQLNYIFDFLGTPVQEQQNQAPDHRCWPQAFQLQDYQSISFVSRQPKYHKTDPMLNMKQYLIQKWPLPLGCSSSGNDFQSLLELLANIIILDPKRRWSAKDCLQHSWLTTMNPFGPAPPKAVLNAFMPPSSLMLSSSSSKSFDTTKHPAAIFINDCDIEEEMKRIKQHVVDVASQRRKEQQPSSELKNATTPPLTDQCLDILQRARTKLSH